MTCHPAPTKGLVSEPFIYHKDRMVLQVTCHPAPTKSLISEPFIYHKDRMVLQETCHPRLGGSPQSGQGVSGNTILSLYGHYKF